MKIRISRIRLILLCFGLVILSSLGKAQLAGNYLGEYQYGNLPLEEPKDLSSLYSQLNLAYRYNNLTLKTRAESFLPSSDRDKAYNSLSQFSVNYSQSGFNIQVGNIYETIGRGLLLRNYEMPSSIWESRGYRVRYGFYKDLSGASASYTSDKLKIKLLRGSVLAVDLPPTLDKQIRRPDLVEAGELSYLILNQNVGVAIMRQTNGNQVQNYASTYIDGFYKALSYYSEYAFGNNDASAFYSGINIYHESFGASLEYKNYTNFLIGAGINDPPTLVKEHSSRLLNRSTHVPILTSEKGYQLELNYQLPDGSYLLLNHAYAYNEIAIDYSFRFNEFYAEYQMNPINKTVAKVFIDYASDPFRLEDQRYTGGLGLEINTQKLSYQLEIEAQHIVQEFDRSSFQNFYTSFSVSKGSKFSASVLFELSNDPNLEQTASSWNYYPGLLINYQPVNSTNISLFAGKRRGGPACNSGVCYDVLDFQGVELRLSTTF